MKNKLKHNQVWYNGYKDRLYICRPINDTTDLLLIDEYNNKFFIVEYYIDLDDDWILLGEL
jgi:hypothetical protein